ncbi:unnamed protein product [Rotaria magnacalcarata]|uniref:Cytochrome c oxidase assembly protein COX15 n=1 Tax=Rotaria magnacalcarata TaxID=392030 RepID=A0A816W392_9BILA|nr:unnamed protein product [Rotaria magnacalcarata]CAF1666119.1 unnamed protein product [Rotaria magnacalcarata]CAF2135365.1 unnamed protein product [Rotaria magnacalcarata]CAF3829962.1 unnamed protein product [Rotaria magnacalcarata]CAF4094450.1 unnamed protein product [Rotaria magnacalcarata]
MSSRLLFRFAANHRQSLGLLKNVQLAFKRSSTTVTTVPLKTPLPPLSNGAKQRIGLWLACSAGMTAGAVALGGITRLTESGLSMTNWHWLNDMNPPRTTEAWQEEFERYKRFPEFEQMNREMTLHEFKKIYYMEFAHRMWGRATGLIFTLPAFIFWRRGLFDKGMKIRVLIFGSLISAQGALGWYMVKSGLHKETLIDGRASVSPYRLAAHLGAAFILYSGLLWNSFKYLTKPDVYASTRVPRGWAMGVHGLLTLTFLTVVAGAFVAGLDAGLVYPTFPKMGDYWIPPEYSALTPWYKNIFENPVAAQFNHRVLGLTTTASVLAFSLASLRVKFGRRAAVARSLLVAMVIVQTSLGIGTLLYHVPISMAAAHQSGSLALLSFALWLAFNLKRVPKI